MYGLMVLQVLVVTVVLVFAITTVARWLTDWLMDGMLWGTMWARAFRLLGIVVVSVFLGYLIGSSGMVPGVAVLLRSPATSPFIVSDLSIQPAEVQPNEIVTITVSVTNIHDAWGIYSLVLKINGVKEAQKQATVDAGSSQDVSFGVTREEPGRYAVFINGLSDSFTVVAPAPPPRGDF